MNIEVHTKNKIELAVLTNFPMFITNVYTNKFILVSGSSLILSSRPSQFIGGKKFTTYLFIQYLSTNKDGFFEIYTLFETLHWKKKLHNNSLLVSEYGGNKDNIYLSQN